MADQQRKVADVARQLFGMEVRPEHIIGETLRRVTPMLDFDSSSVRESLAERARNGGQGAPTDYVGFVADPLSAWIESTFGVAKASGSDHLVRVQPLPIGGKNGAASALSSLTDVSLEKCAAAIRAGLQASYKCEPHPETGRPPFAFRLHQFISRGDTVYASVEPEDERHLTVQGQRFVPGDRDRVLLPLVFCRECGQEYYSVRIVPHGSPGESFLIPRDLTDRSDEPGEPGYFHFITENSWPSDEKGELLDRIPDDWVEEHPRFGVRVKKGQEKNLPRILNVALDGRITVEGDGLKGHFFGTPFRFCLCCGVAYNARQLSDFGKLLTAALKIKVRGSLRQGNVPRKAACRL